MATTWPALLDEMERRVEQARRDFESGSPGFEPVDIPTSAGPIPADCRDRARALSAAIKGLEERIEASLAQLGGVLGRAPIGEPLRPSPTYVDRRA